ncbi:MULTISPECIES: hypothetical protein [Streptomyces]|nr:MULTISPECIES: hypothetical protein [Streptomyces]
MTDTGGRIVEVKPLVRHTAVFSVAWMTSGFSAPGVQEASCSGWPWTVR